MSNNPEVKVSRVLLNAILRAQKRRQLLRGAQQPPSPGAKGPPRAVGRSTSDSPEGGETPVGTSSFSTLERQFSVMEPDGKEDFQKLTELFQQSQIKTYKNIMAEKSKKNVSVYMAELHSFTYF